LISSRTTTNSYPTLPGGTVQTREVLQELIKTLRETSTDPTPPSLSDVDSSSILWYVRRYYKRHDVETATTKKNNSQTMKKKISKAADTLYSAPFVTLEDDKPKVYNEIDKTTSKSVGVLKLSLEIDGGSGRRTADADNVFGTCLLVLGTYQQKKLLAVEEINLGGGGGGNRTTVEKEIQFDWMLANSDGGYDGGYIVLRLVYDSYQGFDSEIVISLK
jgi:hypothetical protein